MVSARSRSKRMDTRRRAPHRDEDFSDVSRFDNELDSADYGKVVNGTKLQAVDLEVELGHFDGGQFDVEGGDVLGIFLASEDSDDWVDVEMLIQDESKGDLGLQAG